MYILSRPLDPMELIYQQLDLSFLYSPTLPYLRLVVMRKFNSLMTVEVMKK